MKEQHIYELAKLLSTGLRRDHSSRNLKNFTKIKLKIYQIKVKRTLNTHCCRQFILKNFNHEIEETVHSISNGHSGKTDQM